MISAYRHTRSECGMTLVEVLVAVVLISVGLLGVAALQVASLRGNQESYARSQASVLAANILDRMRANQIGFRAGEYTADFNETGAEGTLAANDLTWWQEAIDQALPGDADSAAGRIDVNGNIVTVTVRWNEREEQATSRTRLDALMTFQIRSEI